MAADQQDVNHTSSLGWIYVVVSDTRSAGPRQPVPSWLPGSAVAVYGSLLTVVGVLLNATVLGGSLTAGDRSTVPAVRRLLAANLAVVQLAAAVLVVPAAVVVEAAGSWTFGGHACRAWLLGQVLLIASAMWSVFVMDVDCLLRLVAPRRRYAVLAERHPRRLALFIVISSWVVAGLAALPIGLAVDANSDNASVLEDVCAVSLSRDYVIAQSLTAFLLPAAVGLTGSVAIMATKALKVSGVKGERCGPVAVAVVGAVCVLLWAPFFVLYTVLPFCGDGLCIDPATWTLSAWIGHSAVVVAPTAWFVDPAVRSDVRHFVRPISRCFSRGFHDNATSSGSSVPEAVGKAVDESCGLMSVTKYQIHRPAQHHQQPSTYSPSVNNTV